MVKRRYGKKSRMPFHHANFRRNNSIIFDTRLSSKTKELYTVGQKDRTPLDFTRIDSPIHRMTSALVLLFFSWPETIGNVFLSFNYIHGALHLITSPQPVGQKDRTPSENSVLSARIEVLSAQKLLYSLWRVFAVF